MKLFSSKKAEMAAVVTIIKLILAIASFLLVTKVMVGFYGDEISKKEAICEASVGLQNTFTLNVKGTDVKSLPLQCETLDIKVKGDHEEIMKTMSDKVARCWEMFGKGQYDTNMFENFQIFEGEGKCFTCYHMLIQESKDFKEGEENGLIMPQQFVDFLEEEEYGKTGVSYLDYVQYKAGGPGLIIPIFVGEDSSNPLPDTAGISPNRDYAIAFATKTENCDWCWWAVAGGTAGVVVGGGIVALLTAAPSGGGSLVLYGKLVAAASGVGGLGVIGAGTAGIASDTFFEQRDMHTIYVVDVTNQEVKNNFESQCATVIET